MKKYLSLGQIEKVAKDLDIKIEWSGDEKANEIDGCDVCFYTSYGQDFGAWLPLSSVEDFLDELSSYICDYDPSEEAALWIGPDGHGCNGAPYDLQDILDDAKEIECKLKQFESELIKESWK